MDLKQHLMRQIAFSRATYGPGERTEGVTDHIRKELLEIAKAESAYSRAEEWVDVVILGLDGLTRALLAAEQSEGGMPPWATDFVAGHSCELIERKQGKNEWRDWPDWRTAAPGKAIEHVRGEDEV